MSKRIDGILYKLLLEEGFVEKKFLDDIINKIHGTGTQLLSELSGKKLIDESAVLKSLAERSGMPYRSIKNESPEESLFKKIPIKIAWHYQFMPLRLEDRTLTIAVYYPLDIKTRDEIRVQLGYEIATLLSPKDEVLELLKKHYGLGASTLDKMSLKDEEAQSRLAAPAREELEDIEKIGEDATVANLVNQIILEAYRKRATDIHIEPYRNKVRFRYRIDGVLYDANVSPAVRHFIAPILSRIKIMSNLDIVEHRLPQDGQAVVKTSDQKLDLRSSFIPTPYGESVVVRILPTIVLYDIENLGFSEKDKELLQGLLEKPNGIVFVTGPTGSGKTTTLYACLNKLNTSDEKIITIEDPIEYDIDGVTQIQVNPQIGLTFAAGLRSMLRHDPDIMMVGEVRDFETAEIAVRVALTGHLVFSTLHTNSAAASIHRLLDIGIEPYLIYSSTIAFISQRLVRVLCPKCKAVAADVDPTMVELIRSELKLDKGKEITVHKNVGCDYCDHTGFYGRTAVYEILLLDETIQDLIQKRAPAEDIEQAAVSCGMRTMLQNGFEKVVNGITSLGEIMHFAPIGKLPEKREAPPEREGVSRASPVYTEQPIDEKEWGGHDRRTYPRTDDNFSVTFDIFKGISEEMHEKIRAAGISEKDYWKDHHTFTRDISAGGLMFRYNLPVVNDLILDIKFTIPADLNQQPRTISCLAKVIRAEETDVKGLYNIAACFLDMSSADRTALNRFVRSKLIGNLRGTLYGEI